MDKLVSIDYVTNLVQDGNTIAFGGNVLYRSPVKIAASIALSGVKNLHLVKTAIALEADILCGAGCVSSVAAGFVGYEGAYGLCSFYRKGVQSGDIAAKEHACYSVITGLRASAQGVPFLPIRGMLGSDLMKVVGFKTVKDPYTGERLCAVKAIRPDVAFVHVQRADRFGNGDIDGPQYEDLTMIRSAKKVVLSCEEIVDDDYFGLQRKALISEVLTDYIVHLPGGAAPGGCDGCYEEDDGKLTKFKKLSGHDELMAFLREEVNV